MLVNKDGMDFYLVVYIAAKENIKAIVCKLKRKKMRNKKAKQSANS